MADDRCTFISKRGNRCRSAAASDGFCNLHHPDNAHPGKATQTIELKPVETFDDAIHNLFLIAKAAFADYKFDPAVKAVKVAAELLSAREASRGQVDLRKLTDEELEKLQVQTGKR